MPAYPSPAAIATFINTVRPTGPRDPSLWGYAYAAYNPTQFVETGTQGLSDFQAFQKDSYAWVAGTDYWDIDFYLAYLQANGTKPSGPSDFTTWLEGQGYAAKGAGGADAKTGKYPTGGIGYPPGGGALVGVGASGAPAAKPADSMSGALSAAMGFVKANPIPVAVGGLAAFLLFGRK